jgi:hypothetical protein
VADEPKWRDELLARDWEQGSLLPTDAGVEMVGWTHPGEQGLRHARKTVERLEREGKEPLEHATLFQRPLKEKERLVVLTQTCDLIKPPDAFPLVDVGLVAHTDKPAILAEADDLGSARRYRLSSRDEDPPALVLDFGWRMQLDKGALLNWTPDNQIVDGWDGAAKQRFARWLGRRYARPVLDEKDTEEIQAPIRTAWKDAVEADAGRLASWNNEFAEIRFVRPEPDTVYFYMLSVKKEPDDVLGYEMLGWLVEAVEADGKLSVSGAPRSYFDFTLAEHEASQQIDIEWASDDEGSLPADP